MANESKTTKYAGMSEPDLLKALGMDAKKWAEAFCEMHGMEQSLMETWFANAIMAGWDDARKRQ